MSNVVTTPTYSTRNVHVTSLHDSTAAESGLVAKNCATRWRNCVNSNHYIQVASIYRVVFHGFHIKVACPTQVILLNAENGVFGFLSKTHQNVATSTSGIYVPNCHYLAKQQDLQTLLVSGTEDVGRCCQCDLFHCLWGLRCQGR